MTSLGRRAVLAAILAAGLLAAGLTAGLAGLAAGAGTPGTPVRTAAPAARAQRVPARPARRVVYPASFAGSAMTGGRQGLQVFAARSGRLLRPVTTVKSASGPEVAGHPRQLYYLTDGTGPNCSTIMRFRYGGGQPRVLRRFVNISVAAFTVSRDGRMLAYVWSPQGSAAPGFRCDVTSPANLTVQNLRTGARHTLRGVPGGVSGLAWSPRDRRLAVDVTGGPLDISQVRVLAQPLTAARYDPGRPLRCPAAGRSCAEFTPQFTTAGAVAFTACLQLSARTCRYVLARAGGSRTVVLARLGRGLARTQDGAWSAVDPAGSAAIVTTPLGARFATYRWVRGHGVVRLHRPVNGVSW
ncbi:MAG TPA: hypothetical protein VGG35_20750 [Streptosporangiaceae bacterium]|jgi:hypothetical protein